MEIKGLKIAVIGGGVSGLASAQLLKKDNQVTVFEKESTPGGLIRCKRVNGSLFHICGGHVFNSKRQDVLNWFWTFFDRDKEFVKTDRNSVVFMDDGLKVPYPIENHAYLFDEVTQKAFIADLVNITLSRTTQNPSNFEEFLCGRFGNTLYNLYFKPYNEKVWRRDLSHVPLTWLEGKLPMPTVEEMIFNNMNHVEEKAFVHSTFYYEKNGGSQLIADRLAEGLDIRYNCTIDTIRHDREKWIVCGEEFDEIVFCGNIKQLPSMLSGVDISGFTSSIEALESHGTTAVFCEIEKNPYSWIYMPSPKHQSHRIICTGNFSPTNNAEGKMTASIEFTDEVAKDDILENLRKIPLEPKYITHHYNQYTYPIQDADTRQMIASLKKLLSFHGFLMTGRFADWEYYNMDVAIAAAKDLLTK